MTITMKKWKCASMYPPEKWVSIAEHESSPPVTTPARHLRGAGMRSAASAAVAGTRPPSRTLWTSE
jgi:hypothetical protein